MEHEPLDYLATNVAEWTRQEGDQRTAGRRNWALAEPAWGVFGVPESVAGLLPASVAGLSAIELGCGTAYLSSWLSRRGAHPVGIDPTPSQLRIAQELQAEFELDFPLLRSAAERLPFADDSFDLAISEYGAATWADPYLWIPEAARVLRPGGELIFLCNSTLLMLCAPEQEGLAASDRLRRPQFGMHRLEWSEPDCTEFSLSHGDWIRLLRESGLQVLDLLEIRPPQVLDTRYSFVSKDWAQRWPCEEVWKARLVS